MKLLITASIMTASLLSTGASALQVYRPVSSQFAPSVVIVDTHDAKLPGTASVEVFDKNDRTHFTLALKQKSAAVFEGDKAAIEKPVPNGHYYACTFYVLKGINANLDCEIQTIEGQTLTDFKLHFPLKLTVSK